MKKVIFSIYIAVPSKRKSHGGGGLPIVLISIQYTVLQETGNKLQFYFELGQTRGLPKTPLFR